MADEERHLLLAGADFQDDLQRLRGRDCAASKEFGAKGAKSSGQAAERPRDRDR